MLPIYDTFKQIKVPLIFYTLKSIDFSQRNMLPRACVHSREGFVVFRDILKNNKYDLPSCRWGDSFEETDFPDGYF